MFPILWKILERTYVKMVVSNATPLIYLAKVKKLDLLKSIFGKIFISEEVKKEVVDEGKKLNKTDAFLVEKGIEEGWIKVKKVVSWVDTQIEIDQGEISVISLAKENKISGVLIDETPARIAAKLAGLKPKGTIFVLLEAIKLKLIDFEEFLEILEKLVEEGFRLKEVVYLKAIEEARKIRK